MGTPHRRRGLTAIRAAGGSTARTRFALGRRLVFEPLEDRRLLSFVPQLVADINPLHVGQSPASLCEMNGVVYFSAAGGSVGRELWKSDGTAAGTVMVKDIQPGSGGSSPWNLVNVSGTLFFTANDGTTGSELWKSDGTEAGTVLLKDICPGSVSSFAKYFTNVGGVLFFQANDGTHGEELWKSDGTAAGTVLVKDIRPGSGASSPGRMANLGGTLYFSANDGTNGEELWRSDGTAAGTMMLKDIAVGGTGSSPRSLANLSGSLFFFANDGTTGSELWKSDGTGAGTTLVKDIRPGSGGSSTSALTIVDGVLFFEASDGTTGSELWKSDGTAAGTVLVKDICPGTNSSSPNLFTLVNGTLFFRANDGTSGGELWKTDGTAAGTTLVKDIRPGSGDSSIEYLTNVNGSLFFLANDGTHGKELWKSDGSSAGTAMIRDISAGDGLSFPRWLANIGGTLFFSANDGTSGVELWKSDGTAANTVRVRSSLGDPVGSSPTSLTNVNGNLIFWANDVTHGTEVWKSDGTAAGTAMVKDICSATGSSLITNPKVSPRFIGAGDKFFFQATDGVYSNEFWTSNGTTAGTVIVKFLLFYPYNLPAGSAGGTVFFYDYGLWKSDGTTAGTALLDDMHTPTLFTDVGGTIFFVGSDYELWKSDGTMTGTARVKDITPGYGTSPSYLTNVGGTLFFFAYDGAATALWKSDGTTAGTVKVKELSRGSKRYADGYTCNVGGTLFFRANDGTTGTELWKSDGTTAGTVLVKDIASSGSSYPSALTNVGGVLYFVARDGASGYELWKSDGTSGGTVMVKDIYPGASNSSLKSLTNAGGTLFFVADDGVHGSRLWQSDGTDAGTLMVSDFAVVDSAGNSQLVERKGTLYFVAADAAHGWELWKLNSGPTDIALSHTSVAEHRSAGLAVGTLATTDLNLPVESLTYSLADSGTWPDNAAFTIVGNELRTAVSLDFATQGSYTVLVRVTDSGGLSFDKNLTITVTTLVRAPTNITLSPASVPENQPPGTLVGQLSTTDADAGDTFSYALVGTSPDNNSFTIAGNQVWTAASFNRESKSSYTITVRTTDSGALTYQKAITIAVTNVNEAPSTVTLSAVSVLDRRPPGIVVGSFSTSDPDTGDSFTYSLVDSGTWPDNNSFTIVGGQLVAAVSFDSAARPTCAVRVRATDAGGLTLDKTLTLGVAYGGALTSVLVADINPSGDSGPSNFVNVGGTLFFTATTAAAGTELWKSDGTAAGTVLVKDLQPGGGSSSPAALVNLNGALLFTANDGSNGVELWMSDGTAAGTVMLKDIRAGGNGSSPSSLINVNGTLFFAANDGTRGVELWKSDGTAAGTVLVEDIYTGSSSSSPRYLTNVAGTLFFTAESAVKTHRDQVWKSDGTAGGTGMLSNIFYPYSGSAGCLTNVNGTLMFSAYGGTGDYNGIGHGTELWKADGTPAGVVLVKDIRPGLVDTSPTQLTNFNGMLLFTANDGTTGVELWKSDGTSGGTTLVKDIQSGGGNSNPQSLAVAGMTFYFAASGGSSLGLWRSDGTTAGTVLVRNILPGSATAFAGLLLFSANDGTNGVELWKSDGTATGTTMVADLAPGSSSPGEFFVLGDTLYFAASDATHGRELWKVIKDGPPTGIGISTNSVAENQPTATAVGTFSTTDPDAGDSFTYSLVDSGTFPDNGSFTIAGSQLQTAAGFNYEAKSSYTIRVRTADSYGLTFDQALTISVTNVNESPTAVLGGPNMLGAGFDLALNAGGSGDPDAGDSIVSYQWDLDDDGQYDDLVTANPTANVPYAQLVALGEGVHTIGLQVTDTSGLTATASTTLEIKGGTLAGTAGNDTFRIIGRSNDPTIADVFVNNSTATPSYSVVLAAVLGWQVLGGGGSDSLVVEGTSVQLAGSDPYSAGTSLGIGDGATAALTLGLSATLQVRGLAIAGSAAPTGTLDLADGQLIVDGAVTSEAVVRDYLTAGCNGGTWGGPGITSSQAVADAVKYTVGYVRNGDLGEDAFGQWFGHSVSADSILVRRTCVGDTDLDGNITTDDFDLWKYGYAEGLQGWHNGDLDYNGVVDTDDFDLWKYAYTFSYDPLPGPGSAAAAMTGESVPVDASMPAAMAAPPAASVAARDAVFAEPAAADASGSLLGREALNALSLWSAASLRPKKDASAETAVDLVLAGEW